MTKVKDFEDLEIWKSARVLAKRVYSDFRGTKDYGFRDQIQRCAVSVMNNIAEGFCRRSDKEFHHFLSIAKASCAELKSMYYLAEDIEYTEPSLSRKRRAESQKLMNGIGKLMYYLRK